MKETGGGEGGAYGDWSRAVAGPLCVSVFSGNG